MSENPLDVVAITRFGPAIQILIRKDVSSEMMKAPGA